MNLGENLRLRLNFCAFLFALLLLFLVPAWLISRKKGRKSRSLDEFLHQNDMATGPLILYGAMLLLALIGKPTALGAVVQIGVQFFLSYAVYSLLLLLLLPLLRRFFAPACCAALWTLPAMAYLLGAYFSYFYLFFAPHLDNYFSLEPVVTLRMGRAMYFVLPAVWAAGFLGVLGWKTVSHLRFRRSLLREAACISLHEQALYRDVRAALTGDAADDVFAGAESWVSASYADGTELIRDASLSAAQITRTPIGAPTYTLSNKKRKLMPDDHQVLRSPAASVPLAIGLFRRSTRIILPTREYTDDELRLIFRHELCHLLRGDNRVKFFMTLQTALGWFLPSMWLGMERSAQDAELACDELATAALPEAGRRQYASLLLEGDGDDRGFTTCLSATASGLRYRLSRVLHPKKRRSGIVLICLAMALFFSSFGLVGFAVREDTIKQAVFDRFPNAPLEINTEPLWEAEHWKECPDPAALHAALDEVGLYRNLSGGSLDDGSLLMRVRLAKDVEMAVFEDGVWVISTEREDGGDGPIKQIKYEFYKTDTPIDAAVIESLLAAPEDP